MYRLMVAALVVAAVMTVGTGGAAASSVVVGGIGYITGSPGDHINARSGPGTIYEVNVQLGAGQAVEVYDGPRTDSNGNLWYKVRNENGGGWVIADYLAGKGSSTSATTSSSTSSTQQASSAGSAAKIKIGGAVKVTDDGLRIRSAANKSGTVLATVDGGTVLKVVAGPVTDNAGNSWYEVSGHYTTGWSSADYLAYSSATPPSLLNASASRGSVTSRGGTRDTQTSTVAKPKTLAQQAAVVKSVLSNPPTAKVGSSLVAQAERYLGYRYVYGGESTRGFDCSGFIAYLLNRNGYSVGHSLYEEIGLGTRVKSNQLQPGDLVFFVNTYEPGLSHGGIYIGGGKFIHAENESTGVVISDLWNSYYSAHYYGAVRLSN
jgi:peptidoglycan DL-endopeptidase LytF